MATRTRQTLADFEQEFRETAWEERARRRARLRAVEHRQERRELDRVHRHGTLRFLALFLLLTAVAVAVTIAMFETLYVVLG